VDPIPEPVVGDDFRDVAQKEVLIELNQDVDPCTVIASINHSGPIIRVLNFDQNNNRIWVQFVARSLERDSVIRKINAVDGIKQLFHVPLTGYVRDELLITLEDTTANVNDVVQKALAKVNENLSTQLTFKIIRNMSGFHTVVYLVTALPNTKTPTLQKIAEEFEVAQFIQSAQISATFKIPEADDSAAAFPLDLRAERGDASKEAKSGEPTEDKFDCTNLPQEEITALNEVMKLFEIEVVGNETPTELCEKILGTLSDRERFKRLGLTPDEATIGSNIDTARDASYVSKRGDYVMEFKQGEDGSLDFKKISFVSEDLKEGVFPTFWAKMGYAGIPNLGFHSAIMPVLLGEENRLQILYSPYMGVVDFYKIPNNGLEILMNGGFSAAKPFTDMLDLVKLVKFLNGSATVSPIATIDSLQASKQTWCDGILANPNPPCDVSLDSTAYKQCTLTNDDYDKIQFCKTTAPREDAIRSEMTAYKTDKPARNIFILSPNPYHHEPFFAYQQVGDAVRPLLDNSSINKILSWEMSSNDARPSCLLVESDYGDTFTEVFSLEKVDDISVKVTIPYTFDLKSYRIFASKEAGCNADDLNDPKLEENLTLVFALENTELNSRINSWCENLFVSAKYPNCRLIMSELEPLTHDQSLQGQLALSDALFKCLAGMHITIPSDTDSPAYLARMDEMHDAIWGIQFCDAFAKRSIR